MNVLLCISYDGTSYVGFQTQRGGRGVQDMIEQALWKVYGVRIRIIGAARTDSGVHAERSFANFHIEQEHIAPDRIAYVLNSHLPDDVRILCSRGVGDEFHARYSALSRTYYYQLYLGRVLPSVYRFYAMQVDPELDFDMLCEEAQVLVGTHDFSSFTVHAERQRTLVREIYEFSMRRMDSQLLRLYVRGNAFLWKMVRSIIGTLLKRAWDRKQSLPISYSMKEILEARSRKWAANTAPAKGLCLCNVEYNNYGE